MRLGPEWERFLDAHINLKQWYKELEQFLNTFPQVTPVPQQIFSVFKYMHPEQVRVVLYGEDPYPRISSANGVAFWDAEISSWQNKTNGNSLKNMLKALLVQQALDFEYDFKVLFLISALVGIGPSGPDLWELAFPVPEDIWFHPDDATHFPYTKKALVIRNPDHTFNPPSVDLRSVP